MGEILLDNTKGNLVLQAPQIPNDEVMDFRLMVLRKTEN
jgi:hypothetical protein